MVDIPSTCHICRLTLVSSPHLARSYHHLFPVKPFEEMSVQALLGTKVLDPHIRIFSNATPRIFGQ